MRAYIFISLNKKKLTSPFRFCVHQQPPPSNKLTPVHINSCGNESFLLNFITDSYLISANDLTHSIKSWSFGFGSVTLFCFHFDGYLWLFSSGCRLEVRYTQSRSLVRFHIHRRMNWVIH